MVPGSGLLLQQTPINMEAALELGSWADPLRDLGGHARKSLHCHEHIVKGSSGESSEGKQESCRESLNLLREYQSGPEQNVPRNTGSNSHSGEVSDGREDHAIGPWRKGHCCYNVTEDLAESCLHPSVLWKVEIVSNETGYLAECFSKQSVEGAAWLLLNAYHKM